MRTVDEYFDYEHDLCRSHFERDGYRKLSDVLDRCGRTEYYNTLHNAAVFRNYLRNTFTSDNSIEPIIAVFEQGHDAPIDWASFYDYFDTCYNAPDNPSKFYLTDFTFEQVVPGIGHSYHSVMEILDRYRDTLLAPDYDIV